MKKLVFLLCLLCIVLHASAQNEDELAKSDSLFYKSKELYNNQKYSEAISYATEALKIREQIYGKRDNGSVKLLSYLAKYYRSIDDCEKAVEFVTDALNIYKRVFVSVYGRADLDYIVLLLDCATINRSLSNYNEAIRLYNEALEVLEDVDKKSSSEYVGCLNGLAHCYNSLSSHTESIRLSNEALKILERIGKNNHSDYVECLNNMVSSYNSLGNHKESIRLYKEALKILKEANINDYSAYAACLTNVALSYNSLGDYKESIRLHEKALKILEDANIKDHYIYAVCLNNLALSYSSLNNHTESIRLYKEVLKIFEDANKKNYLNYATCLSNLATSYDSLGDSIESIRLYKEVKKILDDNYGKGHPNYAVCLNNLATSYISLGNYAEAIVLSTEALNIQLAILGMGNMSTIYTILDLAYCYYKSNDFVAVESCFNETKLLKSYSELIRKTFTNLTTRERQIFWEDNKHWFENTVNQYAYGISSSILIENAYNATLMAKGILLNSERDFSELIAESGDDEAIEVFNKLRTTRNMLNRLYEKPIADRWADTDSLEKVASQLERELIDRSKVYGDFTHNMTIDWKEVQRKLGSKDVAVEFVSFKGDDDKQVYAAYVINSKMKIPEMVRICDGGELNKISSSGYYQSGDLSRLVWGRLAEYIENAENVYFAPAGELYNIAMESLPNPSGDGLISAHHKMYRLSSTRELAVIKDKNTIERAALYGGLKYNTDLDVLEHDTERYPNVNDRDFTIINRVDSLNLRGGVLELPNTKIEVENISQSFKGTSIKPMLYTGTLGTEASFKALSGKKINIMHIATHGFYWTESEVRRSRNLGFLQIGDNSPRYVEDKALTRSGLLFTGANNVLTGKPVPDNVPDGVLTAKEISVLDLRGLDMVVLSACQTGLGEITGDGVFGLQRGFKKAGANTLLMSLWKVDDRATQMLMTKFYEHFLSGKTKLESLTLAQKYLRDYEEEADGEKIKPFEAPKYWAAFILLDAIN